jgi:S1-C subfamily serine protease
MAENAPSPEQRSNPRWPLILGGLVGGFLLLAAGLALGWYLFYRPIVNVAVQLPAPPPPPALPGPDQAQVKALEEQIEKQKAANKQIEDQIALLKERLKADVCTIKDPLGKAPASPAPAGALPERKTEAPPGPGKVMPAAASIDLPPTGAQGSGQGSGKAVGKVAPASLAQALEQATVLVVSAGGDSGSGFFVAPNYVVTNHHVVARAAPGTEALVLSKHLKNGYIGTVVATSQPGQADFAVIKVDDVPAGSVRPLPVAAEPAALSDVVAAGYPSIAIAQDRNLRRLLAGDLKAAPEVVLTKGTVSAVQNKERNTPMVLHSADISAGNSGGPLIDSCGRVVGINTYIVTSRQTTKANYALGGSWLAAFLRGAKTPFDWRADSCA